MKNENRVLTLAGIAGILVISGSLFYFFIIYLPQSDREKALAVEMARCTEMGTKTFQDEQAPKVSGMAYLNPQYKYFPDLQSCLYKGGVIGSGYITRYINDLYTNKEIVSYTNPIDRSKWTSDDIAAEEIFKEKATELFGSD